MDYVVTIIGEVGQNIEYPPGTLKVQLIIITFQI